MNNDHFQIKKSHVFIGVSICVVLIILVITYTIANSHVENSAIQTNNAITNSTPIPVDDETAVKQVAQEFCNAVVKENYQEAYTSETTGLQLDQHSSEGLHNRIVFLLTASALDSYGRDYRATNCTIDQVAITPYQGETYGRTRILWTFSNGLTRGTDTDLEKDNGVWKIRSLE